MGCWPLHAAVNSLIRLIAGMWAYLNRAHRMTGRNGFPIVLLPLSSRRHLLGVRSGSGISGLE
jgi:hypothetical protein